MRQFSDLEKKIIGQMIQNHQKPKSYNVLNNIICGGYEREPLLPPGFLYEVDPKRKEAKIVVQDEDRFFLNSHENETRMFKLTLTVIELFSYLETQGAARFIQPESKNTNPFYIGVMSENTPVIGTSFLDRTIQREFYKYAHARIFVNQNLINHVENNYQTEEEQRHNAEMEASKKALKITQKALWISLLGLFVAVGSVIYQSLSTQKMEIQGSSIDSISSSLNKMANKHEGEE